MNALKSSVIALVLAPWLELLASNGVSVQPVGTGSLDAATVTATFPITGGTLNGSAALMH
jgi:hypothetical protein